VSIALNSFGQNSKSLVLVRYTGDNSEQIAMSTYTVEFTAEAREDLSYYSAFERKTILAGIRAQLTEEPDLETRNRKQLRENPLATWELRIGNYRVFYEVDSPTDQVTIASIGHKIHNILYIRGTEVDL
jgi:mRNA-degrading endonuclease RelE of RelBE toxin-antitoxin system